MARRGRLADDHAVVVVATVSKTETLGVLAEEVGHTLLMVRGTWNVVEPPEDTQHGIY